MFNRSHAPVDDSVFQQITEFINDGVPTHENSFIGKRPALWHPSI